MLSAGVVDGRNVWRNDLRRSLALLGPAQQRLDNRLWVGPSCSLQHVPHDVDLETELDPRLRSRLAFARQKLGEIAGNWAACLSDTMPSARRWLPVMWSRLTEPAPDQQPAGQ